MKGYIDAQTKQRGGMYQRLDVLHSAIDRHIGIIGPYLKEAKTVLDVGCFDGYFMDKLKRRGFKVKGFDLDIANAKKKNLKVVEWDARRGIPFKDKFDFINIHHTFEHFPREDQSRLMKIFCNALTENGCLCIVVPIEFDGVLTSKHPGLFQAEDELDNLIPKGYKIVENIIFLKDSEIYCLFIKHGNTN